MVTKKLHDIKPREQAATGAADEFQYQQAAKACLELLEENGSTCVFCEWHDDYVVEEASPSYTLYCFHQVKSRTLSQGPWKIRDLFGVQSRNKKAANQSAVHDSIVARMLQHYLGFADTCKRVVFITNHALDKDLNDLIKAYTTTKSIDTLPATAKTWLEKLHKAFVQEFPALSIEEFFKFLRLIQTKPEQGTLSIKPEQAYHELAIDIHRLSEINLTHTDTLKIGKELIELVRTKSNNKLQHPVSEAILRQTKGVEVPDVLRLLSLSLDGYKELRKSGKGAILPLSRLHRLCARSNVDKAIIPLFCRLKAEWDIWLIENKPLLSELDLLTLTDKCLAALGAKLSVTGLSNHAKEIAKQLGPSFPAGVELTPDLVMGCTLALAAATESSQ